MEEHPAKIRRLVQELNDAMKAAAKDEILVELYATPFKRSTMEETRIYLGAILRVL